MWDAHRTLLHPSDGLSAKLLAVPNEIFRSPFTQLLSSFTPTPASSIRPPPTNLPQPMQQPIPDTAPNPPPEETPLPAPILTSPAGPDQLIPDASPPSHSPPTLKARQIPVLPPDVYAHIISFLRRPLHPPNGRNSRSAIRQPDLATMMRVSVLFNNLASLPLYTTVVVDDLFLFAYNVGQPYCAEPAAAEGVRSKAELVELTRRLFLEYAERSDPTYLQVLQQGRQAYSKIAPSGLIRANSYQVEATAITNAVNRLSPFLRLDSVSSSIFLGPPATGLEGLLENPPLPSLICNLAMAWRSVSSIYTMPRPSHFCHRSIHNTPSFLSHSLPPLVLPSGEPQQQFVHLDEDSSTNFTPVLVGGHTSCYLTFDRNADPGLTRGMVIMINMIRSHLEAREQIRDEICSAHRGERQDSDFLAVDFYVPSSWTHDPRWPYAQRELDDRQHEFRAGFGIPEVSYSLDQFELKKLDQDTPSCPCCGWCPDDFQTPPTTAMAIQELEDPGEWRWY